MYNQRQLEKYFKKKSFHYLACPHQNPKKSYYKNFIVIPCYDEYDYIFQTLDSINNQKNEKLNDLLVIIVINNSRNSSKKIVQNNQLTYDHLIDKSYFFEFIILNNFDKNNALDDKIAGVGIARKIGFDYCLNFIKNENALFYSLDADTIISSKYLTKINNEFKDNVNVLVVNFKHQKSDNDVLEKGIRRYETIIKDIASKINQTGSPYGYVSMGSTIICNVKAYISCGGMSKKKATEDFYFLQSLAKYTHIKQIKDILVHPSSRDKQKVYLGTGYRMNEYKNNGHFKNLDYKSETYQSIQIIIDSARKYWMESFDILYHHLKLKVDKKALDFLVLKNIELVWKKIQSNSKNKKQFMLFFHQWFDGLMIIQLLKKLNN